MRHLTSIALLLVLYVQDNRRPLTALLPPGSPVAVNGEVAAILVEGVQNLPPWKSFSASVTVTNTSGKKIMMTAVSLAEDGLTDTRRTDIRIDDYFFGDSVLRVRLPTASQLYYRKIRKSSSMA